MAPGGRTKNDKVRARLLEALIDIREDALIRNAEVPDSHVHSSRLLIANANDLSLAMLRDHAEEVTHVEVIEIDSRYAYLHIN